MKFKEEKGPPGKETVVHDRSKLQILPHFWTLASLDESVRIKAVVDLISQIKVFQLGMTKDAGLSTELSYTMKRLVCGLSSGRKGARQGFATALQEILIEFPVINLENVCQLIADNLTITKSMKGKEEGNNYFGQAFGYIVILQACFARGLNKNKDTIGTVIEGIVSVLGKKSYLKEMCVKSISETIRKVGYDIFNQVLLPRLSSFLNRGWKTCTPEDLMILHDIDTCFRAELPNNFFKANWKHTKIVTQKNYRRMLKPLMDSTVFCHPRVHQVWDRILPDIVTDQSSFPLFWKQTIEDGLLMSTPERKYLAMQLLVKAVKLVSNEQISVILSPKTAVFIVNNCVVKESFLHTAAKSMLTSLTKELESLKNSQKTLAVIFQIVEKLGLISFDYVTKSNVVESLIGQLNGPDLETLFTWLLHTFNSGKIGKTEDTLLDKDTLFQSVRATGPKSCQECVPALMFSVVKNHSEPRPEAVMVKATKFLFLHSYFTVLKATKKEKLLSVLCDTPEDSVREICKQRFQSAISELCGHQVFLKEFKPNSPDPCTESSGIEILLFAKWLIDHPKYTQMESTWTPEVYTGFQNGLEKVLEIKEKKREDAAGVAFELLLRHATLQLFGNTEEAIEILEELLVCYEKSMDKSSDRKRGEEEEPHWTEVIAEILLSFQAQSSHLMRQITDKVFLLILPSLTVKALEIIIEAVRGKKTDDLSVKEEEEEEEEGEETDDEFKPIPDAAKLKAIGDAKKNGEDEDGTSSSEDDDAVMEDDQKFRDDIKAALSGAVKSNNEDDSSEESIDMDEVEPEALEAMDEALGTVFKTRAIVKAGKRKKQEKKKSILHFRLRVLDFLELLIKKQPRSQLILELPTALLEVIANCASNDEKFLKERAVSLLKNKLCRLHVYPNVNDIDPEYVNTKITAMIDMAQEAHTLETAKLITGGIAYLIRVLRGGEAPTEPSPRQTRLQRKRKPSLSEAAKETDNDGRLNLGRVGIVLGRCLKNFMLRKKCQARPHLFSEIISRFPNLGWTMAEDLSRHVSTAINNFRKTQAWSLTLQLLNKKTETYHNSLKGISIPLLKSMQKVLKFIGEEDCKLKAKQLVDFVKLMDKFLKETATIPEVRTGSHMQELVDQLQHSLTGPMCLRSPKLTSQIKGLIMLAQSETPSSKTRKKRKVEKCNDSSSIPLLNGKSEKGMKEKSKENHTSGIILPEEDKRKKKKKKKS